MMKRTYKWVRFCEVPGAFDPLHFLIVVASNAGFLAGTGGTEFVHPPTCMTHFNPGLDTTGVLGKSIAGLAAFLVGQWGFYRSATEPCSG